MLQEVSSLPDLYKVFNLPFGSTLEIIKKTYRGLAKIYHPDNKTSGSKEKFIELQSAYSILSGSLREKYDLLYKNKFKDKYIRDISNTILLNPNRMIYTTTMTKLAKLGLLKTGLRTKDRKKYTGVFHDIDLIIKEEEKKYKIAANLPLTVRVLCPECGGGSKTFCEVCGGIGTYKSSRNLQIFFEPHLLENGKIFELELSRFRPDKFIHFKKKFLRIKINIMKDLNRS
jgi:molecular chaperone DnaJ